MWGRPAMNGRRRLQMALCGLTLFTVIAFVMAVYVFNKDLVMAPPPGMVSDTSLVQWVDLAVSMGTESGIKLKFKVTDKHNS
nr:hypothetical protein BaRGS_027269 [Batillaria attramentaria]